MIRIIPPKFVTFILNKLKHAGHQAYIVGGAVRNACLVLPLTEWDVTTSASSREIKKIFRNTKLFSLRHETITLVDSGRHFEVTPFRGRKNSIEDDLAHRDFTINAMAYDIENAELLDPHGGRKDIGSKVIKATGDPKTRFREDPIRILRAVRLANELGFGIDAKTKEFMKDKSPMLGLVAPEKIRNELMKILMCPEPSAGFKIMRRTGILKYIMPELLEGYLKQQNTFHQYTIFKHIMETVDCVEPVPVLRLSALLHDIAKPRVRKKINGEWKFYGHEKASADLAEEIMDRLRFSKDMIQKTTNLIRHHRVDYESQWTDGAVRRLIRRVGIEQIMELLAFRKADILAHGLHYDGYDELEKYDEFDRLIELKKRIENLTKNPLVTKTHNLAIDGHKVMNILGISPGPEVGNMLNKLIEKVTDNPDLNTEDKLVTILKELKSN